MTSLVSVHHHHTIRHLAIKSSKTNVSRLERYFRTVLTRLRAEQQRLQLAFRQDRVRDFSQYSGAQTAHEKMDFPDPKYRRLCSQATLHTKYGFFPELLDKLTEDVGLPWIDNVFSKQALDKDKIRVCCTDPKVWNILSGVLQNVKKLYREKSAKASLEARLEGDKLMKDGGVQKAVMLYSQSIVKAPPFNANSDVDDGLCLPNALRSRAQAHFALHRFHACLTDLQLCLDEGYPQPLRYQIYRAMGDAYFELREEKRAKISWRLSLKLIDEQILRLETTKVKGSKDSKSQEGKLKAVLAKEREELNQLLNTKKHSSLLVEEVLPPQSYASLPDLSGTRHDKYTDASSFVSIRRTLEQGRFAIASEDIDTGSTLVVEEPFASVLIVDKFGSNCHHCYARMHSPVPCGSCAGLAFCCTSCRSAATYHQYECQHMGLLQGAGLSALAYLALRMLTQEGFDFFKALQIKIEALKQGLEEKLTERESKYVHVYSLTTHKDLRLNEDFFQRTVMSLFLVQCLKGTSFFPTSSLSGEGEPMTEDEMLAASLILHHLQVLQFNAHELYETRTTAKGKTKGSKSIYIAVGIYPTVALFNHECSPAVTRYFHGKSIVIRTVRPLKKGDVISENYGPIYTKRNVKERMRDLTSRYWFKCECQACKEGWPTLEQLNFECLKLRCTTPQCKKTFPIPDNPNAKPRCSSCFNKVPLNEVLTRVTNYRTLFDRGINYLEEEKPDMAELLLTAFLDKIFDVSPPPSREIALAQEALRTCYAQNGNLWILN